MSKAYAKQKAEEKKRSSASSASSYQQTQQKYEQQKKQAEQDARRAAENFTRASTNTKYNQNLQAYMDRLNALKSYGYDVSKPTAQIQQEMKRIQPAVQQENRYMQALQEQRELERRKREARNSQPWAERVGLVDPNEAEMTFGVYDPSASERGRVSNVLAAGGKGWLAGLQNALGFALDPSQPDEAEMFFGKAPTSKLGEKISGKINEALFNQSQRLYGASDELNRQALEHETAAKKGLGKFGQTLVDVGMAGAQMALDAGIGAATGTGMASMGTRTFGQSAREALDSGATYQQAMDYGMGSAAVELGTEKMFDVAKIFGGGGLDKAIEKWIVKYAKTPAGMTILRTIAGASGEGLEEIISSAVNPLLRSGYDPNALQDYKTADYWTDMLHEGLVGALLGGVGVAGNVITGGNARMVNEVNQEALQQRLQRADAFNEAQRKLFAGNTMQVGTADAEAARVLARNIGDNTALNNREAVASYAERYGKTAPAVERVFAMNAQAAPEEFQKGFEAAYYAGREGAGVEVAMQSNLTQGLTENQRQLAWEIGRDARTTGVEPVKLETLEGVETNGAAVDLRQGGERNPVQNPGGQVRQVESGAGSQAQGARIAPDARDAEVQKVKAHKETVVIPGMREQDLLVPDSGSYTADMKKAMKNAAKDGVTLHFFMGDYLKRYAPDGSVRISRGVSDQNGNVWVRADDPEYLASQIALHEGGHDLIARGEIDIDQARDDIIRSLGEDAYQQALDDYRDAYDGADMTDDAVFAEIVCDSRGGMNVFDGAGMPEAESRITPVQDVVRKSIREQRSGETRAPPVGTTEREMVDEMPKGTSVETNRNGEMLIAKSEDGHELAFSEVTYRNGGKAKLERELQRNGHTEEEIREVTERIDDVLQFLKDLGAEYSGKGYKNLEKNLYADILTDVRQHKQVLRTLVKNGDYPVNLDLALVCKKRVAYMKLIGRLVQDGVFDKVEFGGEAIAKVNQILRDDGFETACLGCFVEARRQQIQKWAQTIVSEWNEEVDKRVKNAPSFGFAKGTSTELTEEDLAAIQREYSENKLNDKGNMNLGDGSVKVKMGKLLDKAPSLRQHLTIEDLLTPNGITALRQRDGSLFSLVQQRYGAASPKIVQEFNPYNGEIAELTFKFAKDATGQGIGGSKAYIANAKTALRGLITREEGETKAAFNKRFNQLAEKHAMRTYLYDIGGARMQSFSDFMIENVFDYIQMFADLAANQFPMHGYTKEITALRLFGMTGAKWNGSLIAHVERSLGKEQAGLLPVSEASNGRGIVVTDPLTGKKYAICFDDYNRHKATGSFIQSIGMKDIVALQLDSRYSANVGSITIGVSDAQIRSMLNHPLFSMVIPYHKSGMIKVFAELVGVDVYNDYTEFQNTRPGQAFGKDGNPVEKLVDKDGEVKHADTHYDFNKAVQEYGDAKRAAQAYLEWCAEQHPVYDGKTLLGYETFLPKFSDSPEGYDFTQEENYYKLLEDFTSYDSVTGESAVQGGVTMTFPEENGLSEAELKAYKQRLRETGLFTEKEIEKYAKRAQMGFKDIVREAVEERHQYHQATDPKFDSTYEKVKGTLLAEHSLSFSDVLRKRDADYMAAAEAGDVETAQRMVDEAAKAAGYDTKAYHGTPYRFNEFLKSKIGKTTDYGWFGRGFYFTTDKSVADVYAGYLNDSNVIEAYLSVHNPFVFSEYPGANDKSAGDIMNEVLEIRKKNSEMTEDEKAERSADFSDWLVENGYDGAKIWSQIMILDSEQAKRANVITYDDDGNIIPLSERFNPEKTDIRFSDVLPIEELRRENRALRRETDELRKAVQKWKGETKLTTRFTLREDDVKREAKQIVKDYNSTADAESVAQKLHQLGELILNGENGEGARWSDVRDIAEEIAEEVVGGERVMLNGDEFENFKLLTGILREKPLHISKEIASDILAETGYDNLRDFNRAHMGTVTLTTRELKAGDRTAQDAYYEMVEAMPGWFPEDVSEAEFVPRMLEVLEGLKPVYGMSEETSANYEAAVTWAANDVIDRVLDESIRQNPKTFADRAQAKLEKERARLYQRIRNVREQGNEHVERTKREYAERSRKAIERMQARNEREIQKLKDRQREVRQNERERREEREGIGKYRARVEKKAKQLGDWLLKNSAKEHIPEHLKKPVAEFLATIDFTSKRQLGGGAETKKDKVFSERLRALKNALEKMKGDAAEDSLDSIRQHEGLPPYYMEFLNMLSEKAVTAMENGDVYTINQMTAAELKTLDETITAIVKTIRMMNRLYENGRAASAQQLGFETIEEMDKLGAKKARGEKGDAVRSFFAWDNTSPFYAFKRLGSAAASVFEEIQNGWDRFAFNVIKIMDFTREAYTSKEVREWGGEVHKFELESGEKVYMTTAQIMSLRMLLRREQAVQHIQGGGVRIDDIDAKGKGNKHLQADHFHLTAKDIETITGTLTERQREVANALQKFMQEQGGEWGNHVSRARWDIDFFGEENYFPIVTEDSDRNAIDPEARANDLFRLLNMGATKSLNPNANNALVIRDIFDVFADHMTDMAKYDGLALPILDAMKWLNYRFREETSYDTETGSSEFRTHTVQRAIEKAYGKEALRYLTTFMRDLNGVNESTGRGEGFARKMISNYKVAAVAANLRVALLQPTSYFRALYSINGRYLARALFAKPAVKECEKYSGIAAWKSLGYYDTNIARGVREQIKDSGGVKDKIQEASMKGAEWGDKLTWGALWNACKFAVKNEQPGLDHEALMRETAKKFREVVYSTQVVDSTMTRSHNMRGKSIYGSMATAFMAEPTLSYNIVMDAVSEFQNEARRTNRQEAWKKSRGKVAKAFTVYCLSGLAASIAESLMDAFRDDDEYEKFYQKFLEAMFGEKGLKGRLNGNLANDLLIFNKLPLIKDALSLLSGYSTDRIDMEWMSNAIKAFGAIKEKIELATGKLDQPTKTTYYGNMTWYGAVYLGLKTLSQATGLPVGSATREVVTLWNNTVGDMTGQKIVTYDSKPEKQIQKGFENGWLTEENAIRLLVDEGAAKDEDDAWFKVQKWSTGEGKFDAAVDAMIDGNKKAFNAAVKNLTAHGVKQKSVDSSMKSAINKLYVGTDEEPASISAEKARKMLQDYVGMKADEAADLVKKWSAKIETGIAYGDRNDAYQDGDLTDQQYLNMVTKYGGKTQEDALYDLNEQKCLKQYGVEYGVKPVQQAIIDGDVTKEQAAKIWKDFGDKEDEEIEDLLAAADFVKTHPTAKLETVTSHRVELFNTYAPKTMDGGVFMERAAELYKKLNAGDFPGYLNSKGKTAAFSVMDQVAQWVNSLPLTKEEKIAVFVTYSSSAENNIGRYTWS